MATYRLIAWDRAIPDNCRFDGHPAHARPNAPHRGRSAIEKPKRRALCAGPRRKSWGSLIKRTRALRSLAVMISVTGYRLLGPLSVRRDPPIKKMLENQAALAGVYRPPHFRQVRPVSGVFPAASIRTTSYLVSQLRHAKRVGSASARRSPGKVGASAARPASGACDSCGADCPSRRAGAPAATEAFIL